MKGLDKYLTTPPDEIQTSFDDWQDDFYQALDQDFWDAHENWILPNNSILSQTGDSIKWQRKLFDKGVNAERAARIIERAHNLYQLD